MKIFGILDLSTIDYPKKCASVIFMSGCNMECGYCHNYKHMLEREVEINCDEIFDKIDTFFADGIVISGGEPTLQPDELYKLCRIIKKRNYPIKLDTNGSNLDIVIKLINEKLVDYIAIDVKCDFNRYGIIANYADGEHIRKNVINIINQCNKSNVFVECRTTFVPKLMDENDIISIVKVIDGCNLYAIQEFDNEHVWKKEYEGIRKPKLNELIKLGNIAKENLKKTENVIIRTSNGIYTV